MISAFHKAVGRLSGTTLHERRLAATAKGRQKARVAWQRFFSAQGAYVLRSARGHLHGIYEANAPSDLPPGADRVAKDAGDFEDDAAAQETADLVAEAVAVGGQDAAILLDIEGGFNVSNPRAIEYMRDYSANLITGINEETERRVRDLLADAIEEGRSYGSVARGLRDLFDDFSKDRADLIAKTELGNAYSEGTRQAGLQLKDAGLDMEKRWLTVGDPCPICEDNEAEDWIDIDDDFPSGDDAPLAHPNCECALEVRRTPTEEE